MKVNECFLRIPPTRFSWRREKPLKLPNATWCPHRDFPPNNIIGLPAPFHDVWGRRGYPPLDPRFSPKLTEVSKRSETQLHANLRIPRKRNSRRREKHDTCICALTGTRTSIPGLGNLCSLLLSYEGDQFTSILPVRRCWPSSLAADWVTTLVTLPQQCSLLSLSVIPRTLQRRKVIPDAFVVRNAE